MPATTPNFKIKTPSPSTKFRELGRELQEFGDSIDQVLTDFNFGGQDPNRVLSRVVALEQRATNLTGRVEALETMNRLDIPVTTLSIPSWAAAEDGWQWTPPITVPFPAEKFQSAPTMGSVNVWATSFLVFTMLTGAPTRDGFSMRVVKKGTRALTSCSLSYSAVEIR